MMTVIVLRPKYKFMVNVIIVVLVIWQVRIVRTILAVIATCNIVVWRACTGSWGLGVSDAVFVCFIAE